MERMAEGGKGINQINEKQIELAMNANPGHRLSLSLNTCNHHQSTTTNILGGQACTVWKIIQLKYGASGRVSG